jgi:hypothetical protein
VLMPFESSCCYYDCGCSLARFGRVMVIEGFKHLTGKLDPCALLGLLNLVSSSFVERRCNA